MIVEACKTCPKNVLFKQRLVDINHRNYNILYIHKYGQWGLLHAMAPLAFSFDYATDKARFI